MSMDSPFRPGFGKTPPYLAGRAAALAQLEDGLELGQWPQERGILVTGFRGVGKTVMLNTAEDLAHSRGWKVISVTATTGFFDQIVGSELPRLLNELDPQNSFRVTSLGLAGLGSIEIQYSDGRVATPTFRSMCAEACSLLEGRGGLLFTIDEINASTLTELERFATEYQHLVREDREVAFVGAGVRGEISGLLSSSSATFLRRCAPVQVGLLSVTETARAFSQPIRERGRTLEADVLDYLVRASQGYPFLVQQIGDIAWRRHPKNAAISLSDAEFAYARARRSLGDFILQPVLTGLSATDRAFLAAMTLDDGPSKIQDIRRRMGEVAPGYASMYRDRLINAGVIVAVERGIVTFALPYLREHLRDIMATEASIDDSQIGIAFPAPPELPQPASAPSTERP